MAIFVTTRSCKVTLFTGMQDGLTLPNLHTCQPAILFMQLFYVQDIPLKLHLLSDAANLQKSRTEFRQPSRCFCAVLEVQKSEISKTNRLIAKTYAWFLRNWNTTNPYSKFPTTHLIRHLPHIGVNNENPSSSYRCQQWKSLYSTTAKTNARYTSHVYYEQRIKPDGVN